MSTIRYEGLRRDDACLVVWWDERTLLERDLTLDSATVSGKGELFIPRHRLSDNDRVVFDDPLNIGLARGLEAGRAYFVRVLDEDHIELLDDVLKRPVTIEDRRMVPIRLRRVRVLENNRNIANAIEQEWGYEGRNPEQLAYDLLLQTMTQTGADKRRYQLALTLATEFMRRRISLLPHHHWQLEQSEIEAWLENTVPLSVEFSASKTRIRKGETVSFKALANGFNLTFLWDFGDGGTSTEANPTYTFDRLDDSFCTVTLTVENGDKYAIRRRADYIRIGDPPTAPDVLARTTTN